MTKEELLAKMSIFPDFYKKVWIECMNIPAGETRSYGWIASKIGCPNAARAVGQALAKNPFAPKVPCHRVVKADGSLGGYSAQGGLEQKIALLHREKKKRSPGAHAPKNSLDPKEGRCERSER